MDDAVDTATGIPPQYMATSRQLLPAQPLGTLLDVTGDGGHP